MRTNGMTTFNAAPGDPESYLAAHRYDGAAIQHDRVERTVPCALQPRDVAVIRDVWRYKFLTAPQLFELWWPGSTERAGQRRLRKLVEAGQLERFRPIARRGTFPWAYHLGQEGHRLLQQQRLIPTRQRFASRRIYDYGHVLHDLQLNAWVLAYRRLLGPALLTWEGETDIEPPRWPKTRQPRLGGDWSAKGLREPDPRLVRPDAVLEIQRDADEESSLTFLIEYDRTRRVDKNYGKFRRYDALLNWWWQETPLADRGERPYVVFVCQDERQREQFMTAADYELTGHLWHPSLAVEAHEYVGRRRVLFALERDVHARSVEAWRLPAFPRDHPDRAGSVRRARLPAGVAGAVAPDSSDWLR
jgi:hypothetical protein